MKGSGQPGPVAPAEPGVDEASERTRACVIRETGDLENVHLASLSRPGALAPDHVRLAMRAAALNHLDLFVVRGLPMRYRFPHVLGSDGAGVVVETGRDVGSVAIGDRVMIHPGVWDGTCEFCRRGEHSLCVDLHVLGEHLPGTMAEYVDVPARNVVAIPDLDPPLSWPEAAAFTLVTLTAWRMLTTRARLRAGETVLVWGVGGGVALAAMRIAHWLGAHTIVTSSSDAKLERARELGADVTLNHAREDVAASVRKLTAKRGVDVVVDNVGEATWEASLRALAKGGRLVTCGGTTGPHVVSDVRRLFWNQYDVLGSTLGSASEYGALVDVLARGELRPVVDRTFPLERGREALEYLRKGDHFGKVVLTIDA